MKLKSDFKINYAPDFRQAIADTWPNSIDDTAAKLDWGWSERFSLEELVKVMMDNVDITLVSLNN